MADPEFLQGLEGLNDAYKAIMAGVPQSLTDAGDDFDALYLALDDIPDKIEKERTSLVYDGGPWKGEAAQAFSKYVAAVETDMHSSAGQLKDYKTELKNAADALKAAQDAIGPYLTDANNAVKGDLKNEAIPDYAGWNKGGQDILTDLTNEYIRVTGALIEITVPKMLGGEGDKKNNDDGGKDDGNNDDGGKDDGGKDDGDKHTDGGGGAGGGKDGGPDNAGGDKQPEGDTGGADAPKQDETGTEAGAPDGGPGTGSSPPDGGGNGPGTSTIPASHLKSGTPADSPALDKRGPGSSPTDGKPVDGAAPHGTPAATPYGPGGSPHGGASPNPKDNRILPGTPIVSKDGLTGVDVDHDGKPDIGLDGKPLPGSKQVTYHGVTGLDVDGDCKPDIGPDGEVLKWARIAKGVDGTLGIDINGDCKPDIAISGQVLPDAKHITSYHGIRGLDINHDGKPDIAMDGKPTPWAPLTTYDGLKGVDVNGDCKPDIGMNGEILKWAPKATSLDGILGIDVDGDGKPDIALMDTQVDLKRGADAISSPRIPERVDSRAGVDPATASGTPYSPASSYSPASPYSPASSYYQTGSASDPSTTLTGGAPAGTAVANPYAASLGYGAGSGSEHPGGPPGAAATPYFAGSAGMGGMGGMAGMAGVSGRAAGPLGQPNLVEDGQAWEDTGEAAAGLGRPAK